MPSQQLTCFVRPMGDKAFLVRLLNTLYPEAVIEPDERYNRLLAARYLAQYLELALDKPAALAHSELVAGYDSVLITFEPDSETDAALQNWLIQEAAAFIERYNQEPVANWLTATPTQQHHIPVNYGGEYGLDFEEVASLNKLTPVELIELHSSQLYEVYFVGFSPGFAYLGPLPPGLDAPRLARPRPKVKAGTVALAAGMTAIYPFTSPGGWQLIGYTPTPVFQPQSASPVLFRPGDKVSFYAV